MNLVKELIQSAPVGNRLKFGYHENVIISKLDMGQRKNKGLVLKQNTYTTFSEIDLKTKKITAQSEGSYWDLDHKSDFVVQNFIDQFTSVAAMINAVDGDIEVFQDDVLNELPGEYEDVDPYLKTKEGAIAMQKALIAATNKHLADKIGLDCPMLKCKITTNKKGFFELGRELNWILPMVSEDKLAIITPGERKAWRTSMKADDAPVDPDKVGGPTDEKPVASLNALKGL